VDLPAAVDSCGHLGPPHPQPPQCQQEGRQESSRGTELSKLKGAVALDFSWPIFWPNRLGIITGFTFSEATLIFLALLIRKTSGMTILKYNTGSIFVNHD
jgi:hypothetical protein